MAWINWETWPVVEIDVADGRDVLVATHGALAGGLHVPRAARRAVAGIGGRANTRSAVTLRRLTTRSQRAPGAHGRLAGETLKLVAPLHNAQPRSQG